MSTVKIRRSGTTTSTPSSLDHGELAINYADATLFWKDSTNTIRSFVFQAYASATHKSQHATGGSDALAPSDIGAAPAASPTITGNATFEASSGVPVTITNTGTGNSFVVNDASGDTTPFVVDASGRVGAGVTPGAPLHIKNTDSRSIICERNSVEGSGIELHTSGGAVGSLYGFNGGGLRLFVNNGAGGTASETVRISPLSRVGVNNTAPATALDVNGVITVSATSGSAGSYLPSVTISGDANTGFGQVSGQSDTASVFTAGHERVRVRSDGGAVFGGGAGFANHRFAIIASLTSAGGNIVNFSSCTAQTGVTSVYGNWTQVGVASGVTLSALHHNYVTQGTFTGAVTTQSGFFVESTLTGATNNYGFRGNIASGTGRWNCYMDGTAQNYFAGNVGIGVAAPSAALDINSDKIRLRTAKTPASASDTGNAGDICWDASYLYICTATNTWRRIAHSTW